MKMFKNCCPTCVQTYCHLYFFRSAADGIYQLPDRVSYQRQIQSVLSKSNGIFNMRSRYNMHVPLYVAHSHTDKGRI